MNMNPKHYSSLKASRLIWLFAILIGTFSNLSIFGQVPRLDPDYTITVDRWWAAHPFNPESVNYSPTINSPTPVVNLTSGQSIQTAINGLPATGGTIKLASGTYGRFDISGRSNVHIISDGGAIITGASVIAVSTRAHNYGEFDRYTSRYERRAEYWNDLLNPTKNFYFKNLIFDGQNSTTISVTLKRVYDVVFDNCVFRNLRDPASGHPGPVAGHMGLNNIWYRNCHFVGNSRFATYLDGAHGCGAINCTVEGPNFGSGGFLYLTNDDFTEDINGNGRIDRQEERNAKYIVIYNCLYNGGIYSGLQTTGENILFMKNRFTGGIRYAVGVDSRAASAFPELQYKFTNLFVIGNTVPQNTFALLNLNNMGVSAPNIDPIMGQYRITGNRVNGSSQLVNVQVGPIEGPNVECGNCINNSNCTPSLNCYPGAPGTGGGSQDTQAPTAPSNLSSPARTSTSVSLAWTGSTDNVGVTGYRVVQNGTTVATVTGTSYNVTGLTAATSYTFNVRALDAAGNLSGLSNSLQVTTTGGTTPPPSGSQLASDTFTASNGTNLNGRTTSTGHVWEVLRGGFSIQNNRATHSTAPAYAALRNIGSQNMIVESTITLPSTAPAAGSDWFHGVFAAADVRSSGIYDGVQARFLWQAGSSEIEIWEWAQGSTYHGVPGLNMAYVNLTWHGASFQPGGTYKMRLIVNGQSAKAYIVGQEERSTVTMRLGRAHSFAHAGLSVDPQGSSFLQGSWDDFSVARPSDITAPSTPTGLRVVGTTGSSVTLGWNASSDNVGVAGYIVKRSGTGFIDPLVIGNSTFGTARGLTAGQSYTFYVSAFDADGNVSGNSTSIAVTPANTASQAPQMLTQPVTSATAGSVYFYDAEASGSPRPTYSLVTAPAGMTIQSASGAIRWTPTSAGTFDVSVRASNGVGTPATQTFQVVVGSSSGGGGGADTQNPSIPANLQVTGVTTNSVSLDWNDSTDNVGVTGYSILRNGTEIGTSSSSSFVSAGLNPATTYSFLVRARDAAGNTSGNSATVSATTASLPPTPDTQAPTTPDNFRVTATTTNSVSLAWNASSDNVKVQRYMIYLNPDSALTNQYTSTTNLTVTIGGRKPNTAYSFTIRAKDAAGNYSAPATLTATTSGDGTTPPPPPPSSVVNDTFTGVNGASLNGRVSDSGHTWEVARSSFTIQNNEVVHGGNPAYALVRNIGITNSMIVESKITLPATAPTSGDWFHGLLACADVRNGTIYDGVQARFLWQGRSSEIELWEWAQGTTYHGLPGLGMGFVNLRFHNADFEPGRSYTLRLIVNNQSAIAYIVGQEARTTVMMPMARTHSAPSAGISIDHQASTTNQVGRFDDFRVRRVSESQVPSSPTNLRVVSKTDSTVTLAWDPSTDNTGIAGYIVQRNQSNFQNPMVVGGATAATAWGMLSGQTVTFWVVAFDADGNLSPRSSSVSTTLGNTGSAAPVILTTASTQGRVGQVYRYDVEASGSPRPSYSLVSGPSGMTIDPVSGLVEWTPAATGTSNVSIRASNGLGTAPTQSFQIVVSGGSTTPPPADTSAPSVPSNLRVTATTSSTIDLAWNASTDNVGVTGYRLFRNGTQIASPTGLSYQDTGRSPSTTYSYSIRALDAAGNLSAISPAINGTTSAGSVGFTGVPRIDPDYSTTVDKWWFVHPFNPESSNYTPTINSPSPVVNLTSGQSIQTAIDGLPATGGTIKLAAGTYGRFDISGRSNVHIISDGGAVITGASVIAVSSRAHNYGEFDRYTSRYERRAEYWNDLKNPTKNFYFKNIIFDGQNSTTIGVTLKRVYDVVFDNCVYRNFRDPASGHPGPVAGHMGLNNIWYRNCHFVGSSRFATYLDGAHGSGAINCTVEGPNFGSGGFLYLTNDDFTEDINENGRIDREEERNAKYIVIYDCLYNGGIYSGLQTTGENILFMKNRFTGGIRYAVGVDSRAASAFPELQYKFTNLFVVGNTVPQNTFALLNLNNMGVSAPNIDPIMGQYRITGNRISGSSQLVNIQVGPIEGPNVICGNCVNDSACTPSLNCYPGAPGSGSVGDTQAPTAPSNLRATSTTHNSVSLAWNASTDNVSVSGYRVFRNGTQIATPSSTTHVDQGLNASTSYTYTVRALDAAGNVSGISNSLNVQTVAAPVIPVVSDFPMGMFEDGNLVTSQTVYNNMVNDLRTRGFDSLMMVNTHSTRHGSYLGYTDPMPFNVYMNPTYDFDRSWWPDQFPATIEQARIAAAPVVNAWKNHPSFKGYYVADEPGLHQRTKVSLISQAFRELDPTRPNFPVLIGVDRVGPIFEAARPGRMVIDVYPCAFRNAIGDFTMNGFGYSNLDFVSYIRQATSTRPAGTPLWIVLQAHKVGDGTQFWHLREPVATEIRCQEWLALGEGATGIFWFIYSSEQGWIGLKDNPSLMNECASLNTRVGPLRETLKGLHRVTNQFTVTGAGPRPHYSSTLENSNSTKKYVVIVNRDCVNAQNLQFTSGNTGRLKDLESGVIVDQGTAVNFRPGDGRIYELVP
jgi:chitodextrinase